MSIHLNHRRAASHLTTLFATSPRAASHVASVLWWHSDHAHTPPSALATYATHMASFRRGHTLPPHELADALRAAGLSRYTANALATVEFSAAARAKTIARKRERAASHHGNTPQQAKFAPHRPAVPPEGVGVAEGEGQGAQTIPGAF